MDFLLSSMQLPALKILAASVILKSHLCAPLFSGPSEFCVDVTGCTVVQGQIGVQIQGALGVFFFLEMAVLPCLMYSVWFYGCLKQRG